MSWSFQAIGTPKKVIEALEAHSENISKNPADYSRAEFDEAKPHLIGLVKQNFETREGKFYSNPVVKLDASGSGSSEQKPGEERKKVQNSVQIKLELLYGFLG